MQRLKSKTKGQKRKHATRCKKQGGIEYEKNIAGETGHFKMSQGQGVSVSHSFGLRKGERPMEELADESVKELKAK